MQLFFVYQQRVWFLFPSLFMLRIFMSMGMQGQIPCSSSPTRHLSCLGLQQVIFLYESENHHIGAKDTYSESSNHYYADTANDLSFYAIPSWYKDLIGKNMKDWTDLLLEKEYPYDYELIYWLRENVQGNLLYWKLTETVTQKIAGYPWPQVFQQFRMVYS